MTTKQHADFVKNMDKLEKITSRTKVKARAIDPAQVCTVYCAAKPLLKLVLPLIEKIPVVGKIVPVVRVLMTIADAVCKC